MMNDVPLRIAVLDADPTGALSRLLEGRSAYRVMSVLSVADLLDPKTPFDLAVVDPELDGRWPAAIAAELSEALNDRLILCCRSATDAALLRHRLGRVTVVERAKLDWATLDTLLRARAAHRETALPRPFHS
jgi:hypothetical protein